MKVLEHVAELLAGAVVDDILGSLLLVDQVDQTLLLAPQSQRVSETFPADVGDPWIPTEVDCSDVGNPGQTLQDYPVVDVAISQAQLLHVVDEIEFLPKLPEGVFLISSNH